MKSSAPTILEALRAKPATKVETIQATGLHRATVFKRMEAMHEKHEIFICGWKKHPRKGPPMAVYAVGNKPDAPCTLCRLTKHEIYVRYRDRMAGTEREDIKRAKDRAKWWIKKAAGKKQHPFSALGI